ncbi:DUF4254 domain-containing protein [Nocardia bovistercoris]|uniref:DUF4254 domain-containing protein n=1 Tax=Nocardia bovistercoris TaxID=2785916 RepID=A0A931IGI0_9NOCA|nr:hypothetical protein [Nocardia bovistercoris]MBH0781119.1 hypothetical protein [Nocardia bovistercoris]
MTSVESRFTPDPHTPDPFAEPETYFPSAELLAAISGHAAPTHPIVRWCVDLVDLHRDGACEIAARRRSEIIHDIDMWTNHHVPQHLNGSRLHTESIGAVIDKIARAYTRFQTAITQHAPGDPRVHGAWHCVAELVVAYKDLAAEVVRGQRRLPDRSPD